MDPVFPLWRNPAGLFRWSSVGRDNINLRRSAGIRSWSPPVSALHSRVVWHHRVSWTNCMGTHMRTIHKIYISAPVVESQQAAVRLAECIVDRWMGQNGLKLNAEKTQLMWLGSRHQLPNYLTISQLPLSTTTSSSTVDIVSTANDLGVILDSQLTMTTHVSSVCRAGFFQLRQLRSVRRSLTTEATRALVQAFISCRLDYCNSVLAGVPGVYLQRLQSLQNAAARLVSGARRHDHITPVLVSLHWLPVRQQKSSTRRRCLCGSVYTMQPLATWLTCVCRLTPCVVASNCVPRRLGLCWFRPRARTAIGQRSFAVNGPRTWNSLPADFRTLDTTLCSFKRHLKAHLFQQ